MQSILVEYPYHLRNVNEVNANCLSCGKLQDMSTPPIKNVKAGNKIKIPNEIRNLGY